MRWMRWLIAGLVVNLFALFFNLGVYVFSTHSLFTVFLCIVNWLCALLMAYGIDKERHRNAILNNVQGTAESPTRDDG